MIALRKLIRDRLQNNNNDKKKDRKKILKWIDFFSLPVVSHLHMGFLLFLGLYVFFVPVVVDAVFVVVVVA